MKGFEEGGGGGESGFLGDGGNFIVCIKKETAGNIHTGVEKQFFRGDAEMVHKRPVDGGDGEVKLFCQIRNLNGRCRMAGEILDHFAEERMFDRIESGAFPFDDFLRGVEFQDGSGFLSLKDAVQCFGKTQAAFIESGRGDRRFRLRERRDLPERAVPRPGPD